MAAPRLLLDGPGEPAWNMAVDEAILRLAALPTLRLYRWTPPAISLGRFQPGRADLSSLRATGLPLVRRMTGGGAILHAFEVTYSVTLPLDHPLVASAELRQSYQRLHAPIREALHALGVQATTRPAQGAGNSRALLCFQRVTSLDLVVGGRKLVGSAQRRLAGRMLQHGSLILRAHPLQPGTASLEDLLHRRVEPEEVEEQLAHAFAAHLGEFRPAALEPQERIFAEKRAPAYRFR